MENKYTSLEFSIQLKEAGFEGESEYWYIKDGAKGDVFITEKNTVIDLLNPKLGFEKVGNAYDILNDICCKYAKEFFGELDICYPSKFSNDFHIGYLLRLMQQGEKQEAEDYIWEHTIFNPKNKGAKLS